MKNFESFTKAFNEDRKHLETFGISPFEMDLMLDAVKLGE